MKRKVAFTWLDAAACLFLPLVITSPLFGQTTYTARGYVLSVPNSGFTTARPFTTPDAASTGSPMSVVGSGSGSGTGGYTHALLWSGADQIIDLNPAGFAASDAAGTSSTEQVGEAFGPSNSNIDHA